MKVFAFVAASLLSGLAYAGSATLSTTMPTQNTDGSTITLPLSGNVYRGLQGQTKTLLTNTASFPYVDSTIGVGIWCYQVTAVEGTPPNTSESAFSNESCKTIAPPIPKPPASLLVAGGPAYSPSIGFNKLILTAVGTAPAQKTCDPAQDVNGLNVVPRTAIKLNPGVKLSDVKTAVTLCVS